MKKKLAAIILLLVIIVLVIYSCTSKTASSVDSVVVDTTATSIMEPVDTAAVAVDSMAIDYPDEGNPDPNILIPSYVIITNPYSFPVKVEISVNPPNWQTETLGSYDKAEFSASFLFARICSNKTDCNTYKLVRGENYFVQYEDDGKWIIGAAERQ